MYNYGDLIYITGATGSGKTSFAVYCGIDDMFGENAREALKNCEREVERYRQTGYSLNVPQLHLVHGDIDFWGSKKGFPRRLAYRCNGFRFALPNDNFVTDLYPFYSTLIFSDSTKYWDSHLKPPILSVLMAFRLKRHARYKIYLDAQKGDDIQKSIRELSNVVVEMQSVKFLRTLSGGIVTKWKVREFLGYSDYEGYLQSQKTLKDYEEKTYTFDGDIRQHYDSYCYGELFLPSERCVDFTSRNYDGCNDYEFEEPENYRVKSR